jgi:hypothetical protein
MLGVTIDGKYQKPLEIKKNEALEYKRPENIKELRRFLEKISREDFSRRFLEKISRIDRMVQGLYRRIL